MNNSLKNYANEQKTVRTSTPQRVRTPGKAEVKNNAGGFVFKVSDKDRLERFLILGTDGGTYYVGERKFTEQNVKFLKELIKRDERLVVDTIVDVSNNGRAFRNTPAIFALALVLTEGEDKAYARQAVSKVVRTGTHLFEFATFIDSLGGWGRAKRKAVADWYTEMPAEKLAYQVVKYRQRQGWTHRDLFRKAHPEGVNINVGNFILGKGTAIDSDNPAILDGYRAAQAAGTVKETIGVLDTYKSLPWEALRTEHLNDADVWKKLFYNGQLNGQALVRQITRLARMKAFNDLQFAADYAARLTDEEMIRKTRLHPINFLNASVVHQNGTQREVRDSRYGYSYMRYERVFDWTPVSQIVDALDAGFHTAFKTVEPAGKRTMLAIDVSGSMSGKALGLDLSCAQVSGAMAMTIARTEPAHIIRGFTTGSGSRWNVGNASLTDLGITAKTPLNVAMQKVLKSNFGGTDCAQPMLWAKENKMEVDHFITITDNETWAGNVKPHQALDQYKQAMGIDAKATVVGVASNDFTIADPDRKDQFDVVGFDANAPRAIADFAAGRI